MRDDVPLALKRMSNVDKVAEKVSFDLNYLPAGVYFVRHDMVGENGITRSVSEKLMKY